VTVSTTFAVTMTALVPGAGIATYPALRDLGDTLAPLGWAACAYVGMLLVALLGTIAVRSRPKAPCQPQSTRFSEQRADDYEAA